MAQVTTPKIEELRLRLQVDPKSRLFFPLAEELRKVGELQQADEVLRTGLAHHPTYLSAWVSFGRVLREEQKNANAIDALSRALQLDPGNVVAARLLADCYEAVGEKVEAIKKYKLVHALMPGDQELEAIIERLDREINRANAPEPVAPEPQPEAAEAVAASEPEPEPPAESIAASDVHAAADALFTAPQAESEPEAHAHPEPDTSHDDSPFANNDDRVFADAAATLEEERQVEIATGDVEPMSAAHEESPFEEPDTAAAYGSAAFEVEQPQGMHIAAAPLAADVASPWEDEPVAVEPQLAIAPEPPPENDGDVFPSADVTPFPAAASPIEAEVTDFTDTLTMADLYVRQGLIADARHIYENILHRDPDNADVRAKLEALPEASSLAAPLPEPELPPDDEATPFAPEDEAPLPSPIPFTPRAVYGGSARHEKIAKLQGWLEKVARREAGRV
jgi:tetratricopeptide (TPR) repeat protein